MIKGSRGSRFSERTETGAWPRRQHRQQYHGNYRLSSHVRLGNCDVAALDAIGDRRISELAHRLKPHIARAQEKSLKETLQSFCHNTAEACDRLRAPS